MLPKVRVYEPSDREGVVALWNNVFADDPPWNEPSSVIDRKLTVQPDLFFVCEWNGRIVGTVIAGFDGHRGWVHKVATDPSCRRQGIAGLLMEAAEQGLASKGCRKLNLQVRAGNEDAVSFYHDLGFAVEQRTSMSKHIGGEGDA
jgi:ribosomal protein S18 acetylase RimI-like enzyme